MENKSPVVGIMIAMFIVVLLGAVMISISADQVNDVTGLQSTSDAFVVDFNEATEYTLTEAPTGWKADATDGCAITSFVLTNATDFTYTVTTDYVVDLAAGTLTFVNSTDILALDPTTNATTATYSYCGDGYQTGFSSTAIKLVVGFFALAIMVSVAFLIFWILRREGVDI